MDSYKKKYEQALAKAKNMIDDLRKGEDILAVSELESMFPELKGSEDERIRKKLIDFLWNEKIFLQEAHSSVENNPKYRFVMDAIAWLENIPYTIDHEKREGFHLGYKAGLEKQGEQKPLKVYRVENEAEEKGLWRKFDGTWQPLFDMLTDGKCKDMPMEDNPIYREGGKRWFASAPSKKALREWFSKRDLEELVSKGFIITEFEVAEYKKVSDFEYIFTRDNIINKCYLEVSDIYPEQKPAEWSEEDEVRLQTCLDTLQAKSLFGVVDTVMTEWLKSLKQRLKGE